MAFCASSVRQFLCPYLAITVIMKAVRSMHVMQVLHNAVDASVWLKLLLVMTWRSSSGRKSATLATCEHLFYEVTTCAGPCAI